MKETTTEVAQEWQEYSLDTIGFQLADRMGRPLTAAQLVGLCNAAEYKFYDEDGKPDAERCELMLQRAFDNFKSDQSASNWNYLVAMMAAWQSISE